MKRRTRRIIFRVNPGLLIKGDFFVESGEPGGGELKNLWGGRGTDEETYKPK